jgi:glycosyltransferase involved in cell wall biosynthesis
MKEKNNLKLYLVVYACEPHQGGEHEVGWKIANEMVNNCDLTVITRKANQQLIDKNNINKVNFIFIENDFFVNYKPKGEFSYFYYLMWQLSVYLYLKNRVKKEDIIHYLTFGNIHLPHFLVLLRSKLVIGPMGGGSVIKTGLMRNSSFKTKLKSNIYHLINWTVKLNPIYYVLFIKSSKIILRTEETLNIIPKYFHKKCTVFLETGIDSFDVNFVDKERKLKKIITTARLNKSKNIDQVIEVFNELVKLRVEPIKLDIIGDGPMLSELKQQFSGIENLTFLGKVPHENVHQLLSEADLFLFCSIKEGGSHSLFEAAFSNIPIACYNVSGMQEFPKDNSAIKISPTNNIDSNIFRLAKKIDESFNNQNNINSICANAVQDLKSNYDWKNIVGKYLKIYKQIN